MKIIKLTVIFLVCALITAFLAEISFKPEKTYCGDDGAEPVKTVETDYSTFASGSAIGDIDAGRISANSAILCADNGIVIFEKQADIPLPMASITKVMSCIIALENIDDLKIEVIGYCENKTHKKNKRTN